MKEQDRRRAWPVAYREMVTRWSVLQSPSSLGVVESRVPRPPVAIWRERMERMRHRTAVLASAGRWSRGPADLMTVLGVQRLELHHSALLRWALDPLAGHGLGSRLLEKLWTSLWPHDSVPSELWRARVRTEVAAGTARADVLATGPGWGVLIENKVDAPEQPRQGDRLVEQFPPPIRHVWLSPGGVLPSSAPRSLRAWTPLTHRTLAELVRAAAADSVRVAPAVLDWAHTLAALAPVPDSADLLRA